MMKAQCECAVIEQTMGYKALFYTLGTAVIKPKGRNDKVDLTVNSHLTKRLAGKQISCGRKQL